MTLYALQPSLQNDSLDDAPVVDQSQYGWQYLEQAVALWRLVSAGNADEIEAIMDRASAAAGDGEIRFYLPDLRDLVRLLSGVETSVVQAGIVDHEWRVPADRLEALAAQVPGMDLQTPRSLDDMAYALGEVMTNVIALRNFLTDAVNKGCVVVLG